MRPILRWLPAAAAATALAYALSAVAFPAMRHASGSAGDVMPLRLGARALLGGADPTDPTVLEAQFRARPDPVRLGGFQSYYPPTASVMALPLAEAPFRGAVRAVRRADLAALVLGATLSALAGFGSGVGHDRRAASVACALGCAAAWTHTRLARAVLGTAQVSPLVVAATALALFALARRRDTVAGILAGIGVALKLAPVALVPALVVARKGRALAWLCAVPIALAGVAAWMGEWDPLAWVARVSEFATRSPPLAATAGEPSILVVLCRWRLPIVGTATAVVLAIAARRPEPARNLVDMGMLGVGALGVAMAGTPHGHEALVGLPALSHALCWPVQVARAPHAWIGAGATLAAAVALGGFDAEAPSEGLRWMGILGVAFVVCAARVLSARPGR